METARVVLKRTKTYKLNRVRYIKNVPTTVRGDDQIKMFEKNGYFHVTRLKETSMKKLKKRKRNRTLSSSGKTKKKKKKKDKKSEA